MTHLRLTAKAPSVTLAQPAARSPQPVELPHVLLICGKPVKDKPLFILCQMIKQKNYHHD
jgi:hypothetical protein